MPILTGNLTQFGAVVSVSVGVSANRRAALGRAGMVVPQPVSLMVQLDTGAHTTGLVSTIFDQLKIGPVGIRRFRTPSTTPGNPHEAPMFDVVLSLAFGTTLQPIPMRVVACEDFDRDIDGDVHGILGIDVLNRYNFTWLGPDRRFTLAG